ncbi:MAG: HD domain-containing protein [Chlorobium sp.]|nr:HD domain-containing protein [Chlorobium sp.]
MNVVRQSALLDELLAGYKPQLALDYDAYRNHCLRLFNFCMALAGDDKAAEDKIAIAAVFHDLGIWTENTLDYLAPSQLLAQRYLEKNFKASWCKEIDAMISEHHKITRYKENPAWLVEAFRKADLIDLSGGLIRFRLPDDFVSDVLDAYPNAGFHKILARLAIKRLKTNPSSPLPMMKW